MTPALSPDGPCSRLQRRPGSLKPNSACCKNIPSPREETKPQGARVMGHPLLGGGWDCPAVCSVLSPCSQGDQGARRWCLSCLPTLMGGWGWYSPEASIPGETEPRSASTSPQQAQAQGALSGLPVAGPSLKPQADSRYAGRRPAVHQEAGGPRGGDRAALHVTACLFLLH